MKKLFALLSILPVFCLLASGQETEGKTASKPKFARATFNSTRIINMQSTEIVSPGSLQFMISHHFSPVWNNDATTQDNFAGMFGLNSGLAYTYLSFDYSPSSYLNLGLAAAGRNRYEGWAKFRLLRQQTGSRNVPFSVSWFSLFNVNAAKDASVFLGSNKWSYLHQLLISRKISDKFSLELIPSVIHFNVVPYGINNSNQVWSLGLGGKYKLAPKKNITFEYSRQLNMHENIIDKNGTIMNYNPDLVSVGLEFNTGGHLFQFYIGNTTHASAIDQLARNPKRPDPSSSRLTFDNIAFGFTINRSMSLKKE